MFHVLMLALVGFKKSLVSVGDANVPLLLVVSL